MLVEALGWIRQFRDRYVVVKVGGSTFEDPAAVRQFLLDIVFMEAVGMRPIIVHGGGKAINRAMADSGIEPRFIQGRRYTDDATMDIVARTLTENCDSLVDEILSLGGRAIGLHPQSQNVLLGERITIPGDNGEPVDLGRVGHVSSINRDTLTTTCRSGAIPVIPSLALDKDGGLLNINADTAAADVARLLPAEKLVFISDVPGIMRDRNNAGTLISHLSTEEVNGLIASGVIDSGMVPKVEAALAALEAGCRKVHIIDGRIPHAILLEVYFDKGIGTEIVR